MSFRCSICKVAFSSKAYDYRKPHRVIRQILERQTECLRLEIMTKDWAIDQLQAVLDKVQKP